MDSPNLDRALRFKSNALRGGVLENVYMRNVEIGRVAKAAEVVNHAGHIAFENVTIEPAKRGRSLNSPQAAQ